MPSDGLANIIPQSSLAFLLGSAPVSKSMYVCLNIRTMSGMNSGMIKVSYSTLFSTNLGAHNFFYKHILTAGSATFDAISISNDVSHKARFKPCFRLYDI
jgi:hypothetical protein